jgi:hypothetical protein
MDQQVSSEQADVGRVRRIHIVGGSGSGKTTLAQRLAACLDVPAHDLDEIAYEGGAGNKRTLDARLTDTRRIASKPGWITEGIYLWWAEDLFRAADLVMWLDLPWRVAAWRIAVRHARAGLSGNNRHPGVRKLLRFLRGTRSTAERRERAPARCGCFSPAASPQRPFEKSG